MGINGFIWTMATYTCVQYGFSRYVASQINKVDPSYFGTTGADAGLPVGMGTSLGILTMMFDTDLPCSEHGPRIKKLLYVARIIYGFTIPLAIVLSLS